jgi:hypothetical protein
LGTATSATLLVLVWLCFTGSWLCFRLRLWFSTYWIGRLDQGRLSCATEAAVSIQLVLFRLYLAGSDSDCLADWTLFGWRNSVGLSSVSVSARLNLLHWQLTLFLCFSVCGLTLVDVLDSYGLAGVTRAELCYRSCCQCSVGLTQALFGCQWLDCLADWSLLSWRNSESAVGLSSVSVSFRLTTVSVAWLRLFLFSLSLFGWLDLIWLA